MSLFEDGPVRRFFRQTIRPQTSLDDLRGEIAATSKEVQAAVERISEVLVDNSTLQSHNIGAIMSYLRQARDAADRELTRLAGRMARP